MILTLTICTIAGAVVGAGLMWWFMRPQFAKHDRLLRSAMLRVDDALEIIARIDRALAHIGPYKRGANGTAQKVAKILRGEIEP